MTKHDVKLLDCTLRDGGYINQWQWGFGRARDIIRDLVKAGIDVIEVGFLRNVDQYDPNVTVCDRIEELERLLPEEKGNSMFSAMAMRSNYDISKLSPYRGTGIEMIRITAHDYDIEEGMDFARKVKAKGYKLSINPINIMGYSDERILWILKQVNEIQPYQFSIVDTFGSMRRRDLDRIVSLVDNNLDRNIRVALHLHENMSLSYCLAQCFVDKHLNRPTTIDASLMGMGRIPGNLPIELMADYLNDHEETTYDIDYIMDAIQDHIARIKGDTEWGYTPAYFLSARFNLHRNYAEHYLKKGDLTNRDINHILSRFEKEKATVFDADYADRLYEEYKDNQIDDSVDRGLLEDMLMERDVLLLAPGASIIPYAEKIKEYIKVDRPIVISVNFIPEGYAPDLAFFSNSKRFDKIEDIPCKTIVTSNITYGRRDYVIDHNSVSGAFDQGCNSLIMLLKLIRDMNVKKITIAGADGYKTVGDNYYNPSVWSYTKHDNKFNIAVSDAIRNLGVDVDFLTPSEYALG